jgi:hypothetical protein
MRAIFISSLLKRSLAALSLLVAVGLAKLPVSSDTVVWAWLLSLLLALPFLLHPSLRPLYGGWGLSIVALVLLIAVGHTATPLAWQVFVFALVLLATVLPSEGLVESWRPGTLISAAAGAAQLLPRSEVNSLPLGSDFDLALLIVGSAALLSRYISTSPAFPSAGERFGRSQSLSFRCPLHGPLARRFCAMVSRHHLGS